MRAALALHDVVVINSCGIVAIYNKGENSMNKKIRNLFIALSGLFLSVGAAVGVGLNTDKNSEVKEAKADTTKTLYINSFEGWSNFSYYLYDDTVNPKKENAPWPGVAFTNSMKTDTPNQYDEYQYKLTIDTSLYKCLILVGNYSGWGGDQCQTDDLVISTMPNNGIYTENTQIPATNKMEVGYYGYTTKTIYMLDLRGNVYNSYHNAHVYASGKSGTTWPGVAMTPVAGTNNMYSAEINSNLNRVIFNNKPTDGSATNQTEEITLSGENVFIVYPDNGHNDSTLKAAKYIDKYMKFETVWPDNEGGPDGNGYCKSQGWYTAAKNNFPVVQQEKDDILAHEPTKERLAKWAEANEEIFNTQTGVFSSKTYVQIPNSDGGNSNAALLIVIGAAAVSLLAVGGYFFIRKRKEF